MANIAANKNTKKIKTLVDDGFKILESDYEFKYQKELTKKLDMGFSDFSHETINEIVLWKVNRYVNIKEETLAKINSIQTNSKVLNEKLTKEILSELLATNGIRLPMASSILRFRNPNIYQIIDQRVFRILYGDKKITFTSTSKKGVEEQIDTYMKYLKDLKIESDKLKIPFQLADRVLYMADKRLNKELKLDNY